VNEVFDFRPTKTHPHLESQCGKAATCPEGTWEISRWYKPPVTCTKMPRAPAGAAEIARRPFRRPCRGSPHFVVGTGGLHHRLISATPPASASQYRSQSETEFRGQVRSQTEFGKEGKSHLAHGRIHADDDRPAML